MLSIHALFVTKFHEYKPKVILSRIINIPIFRLKICICVADVVAKTVQAIHSAGFIMFMILQERNESHFRQNKMAMQCDFSSDAVHHIRLLYL